MIVDATNHFEEVFNDGFLCITFTNLFTQPCCNTSV